MLTVQLRLQRGEFALDVSFAAPTPGVVALFGRSGCGKSTLVNLIAGLLRPDAGSVHLDDEPLLDTARGKRVPAERRRIGYVFQDGRLFPHFNVAGNLRYGLRRAPVTERNIGFEEVVALLGLEALLLRRPGVLSGGERQRVALGRALLSQPRLLLLDEPLAALDQARREEVLPYLERVRDRLGIPIVYVSHQFDEVLRLATHVVLLEAGRVLAAGDLQQISLRQELRTIIGAEALGAVVQGTVQSVDPASGLASVSIGQGQLSVDAGALRSGQRVRLQLLARDLILALQPPQNLSVRNMLAGTITALAPDDPNATLVSVDVGGALLVARVTNAAVHQLALRTGMALWVLVKTVTLRGHLYPGAANA